MPSVTWYNNGVCLTQTLLFESDISEIHKTFDSYRLKMHLLQSFNGVSGRHLTSNTWSQ